MLIKRVLLLIAADSAFGRRLLGAITAFAHRNEPWLIYTTEKTKGLGDTIEHFRPDGIIIGRVAEEGLAEWLSKQGLPCVFVAISGAPDESHPVLMSDHAAIGRMGAEHLLEVRAIRYAFVGYHETIFSVEREQAFRSILERTGRQVETYEFERYIAGENVIDPYSASVLDGPFSKWLSALPKPCAIMAANDRLAHAIALICLQLGIQIPEEAAILGVDDEARFCQTVFPPLTSIRPPAAEQGWEAARLLADWMAGNSPKPGIRRFSGIDLVRRQSTLIHRVDDPVVERALLYIQSHVGKQFSIGDLQNDTGISRRALELRFKEALGRTPLMEVRRQRIEHAKEMLLSTGEPISKLSRLCGFSSPTRFCIVFKELTGLSPVEYRRKLNPAETPPT